MRNMLLMAVAVMLAGPALVSAAQAGAPSEAVRFFYAPVRYEPDPELRSRFTAPATTLFEQNDRAVVKNEGLGCIDFSPGIDGQDFDDATVKKSLKLAETVNGDTATVTATFKLFPSGEDADREMLWTLKQVDGKWLVSDLKSVTNDWTLSDFTCEEPQ